ncbi:hypothetical protein KGM_215232 [Danaus plexippus plexippus]|uniref:Uncharacterized protein n=1 Tax=Danaus plexippus plexippus TaxID=278856 RepID=A0A212EQX7_DANPL|nr:hypothetical protein KGM_215232 [Danaus plexippus plexippus]
MLIGPCGDVIPVHRPINGLRVNYGGQVAGGSEDEVLSGVDSTHNLTL